MWTSGIRVGETPRGCLRSPSHVTLPSAHLSGQQPEFSSNDRHDHVRSAFEAEPHSYQPSLHGPEATKPSSESPQTNLDGTRNKEEEEDGPGGRKAAELENVDPHAGEHEEDGRKKTRREAGQALSEPEIGTG